MPVTTTWDDEARTILLQTFAGAWTLEEYYADVDRMDAMLASVDHPVRVIIDLSQTRLAPRNLLTAMRYADKRLKRYKGGASVLVTANPAIHATLDLARKLGLQTMQSVIVARSVEEARKILAGETT